MEGGLDEQPLDQVDFGKVTSLNQLEVQDDHNDHFQTDLDQIDELQQLDEDSSLLPQDDQTRRPSRVINADELRALQEMHTLEEYEYGQETTTFAMQVETTDSGTQTESAELKSTKVQACPEMLDSPAQTWVKLSEAQQ